MTILDRLCTNPHLLINRTSADTSLLVVLEQLELEQEEPWEFWGNDYENGVSFEFEVSPQKSFKLITIFVFVSADAAEDASLEKAFRPFPGSLPYALKREMGRAEVEAIMGTPVFRRKEIADSPAGFLGAALKYRLRDTANVLIEFKESKIHRIVVTD
ncbi:hypothetical protein [Shimia sp. NS0008-38b]|uniref:hypothetical protein n=1 Tax=Shimia sp. NS0008-38b TaxID=3127653 RepID=UPI00333FE5CD